MLIKYKYTTYCIFVKKKNKNIFWWITFITLQKNESIVKPFKINDLRVLINEYLPIVKKISTTQWVVLWITNLLFF